MSTEISTTSLKDKIRERVINEFSSLISDEEWDTFIDRTLHDLTHDRVVNGQDVRAPIRDMIMDEMKAIAAKQIKRRSYQLEALKMHELIARTLTNELLLETGRAMLVASLHKLIVASSGQVAEDLCRHMRADKCVGCGGPIVGLPGEYGTCTNCHGMQVIYH